MINSKTPAVSLILLLTLASGASAQDATTAHQTLIYGGQSLDLIGAHVSSWGGGTASDHQGDAFTTAGHAVHMETAGLFQGGSITLDTPVSLGNLKADPTRYLQIIFSADPSTKFPKSNASMASQSTLGAQIQLNSNQFDPHFKYESSSFQIAQAGGPFGGPGSAPFNRTPGGPPRGVPGGPPSFTPDMAPGIPAAQDDTSALPDIAINQLHVVLVFSDGSEAEMVRPITLSVGDDISWLRAGISLAAIPLNGSEATDANLKQIRIGTDTPAILNIGEIRLVNDTTPITADAGKSETVPAGTTVTLVGTGEGGASALKYEWDFDSPGQFIVQGDGVKVTHTFATVGDYTVTLKVSDVDAVKKPATSTVIIHVNDQGPVPGSAPRSFPGGPPAGGPPPGFGIGAGGPPAGFIPGGGN